MREGGEQITKIDVLIYACMYVVNSSGVYSYSIKGMYYNFVKQDLNVGHQSNMVGNGKMCT